MTQGSGMPDPSAAARAVEAVLQSAVRAQEQGLGAASDWSASTLKAVTEQAESYTAVLRAVEASLTALESALRSQAETNQALTQSLEATRAVVTAASSSQERNVRLASELFGGTLQALEAQLEALRTQLQTGAQLLNAPAGGSAEAFRRLAEEWVRAYTQVLDTSVTFLRAGRGAGPGGAG